MLGKFLFILIVIATYAFAAPENIIDSKLHTTIFHNRQQKTLRFLVKYEIGYGDTKHCAIVKRRIFTSVQPDKFHAYIFSRQLVKQYGPALFTCVHEKFHVLNSRFPDRHIRYVLKNNGKYYTKAIPAYHHIYPLG